MEGVNLVLVCNELNLLVGSFSSQMEGVVFHWFFSVKTHNDFSKSLVEVIY